MSAKHRPRLRPFVQRAQDPRDPDHVYLVCTLGLARGAVRLNLLEYACLDFFDGENTLPEIHQAVLSKKGLPPPSVENLHHLLERLDENLFLESPGFRELINSPVRPPRCIGCYSGDPKALRAQMRDLFERGSGMPTAFGARDDLRAVLVPHIDYPRGGLIYTWGFKELAERTSASLFVIIGTSHYSRARFTLTRKHFQTPLGIVPTDQAYVDRLVGRYGEGLFEDELAAHLPEHSIELEVVFLQYLFEGRRDIRIVPLVVGPFHDCIVTGVQPQDRPDIQKMIRALQAAEDQTGERICYVISGDLAHIGPKFNDGEDLTGGLLRHSEGQDRRLLEHLVKPDRDGYFEVIAQERDQRNICGLPPTYLTLAAAGCAAGQVLAYDKYVHPRGHESVSFASAGFYG